MAKRRSYTSSAKNLRNRKRQQLRRNKANSRDRQLERLEDRRLLTLGPRLAGILANDGELLREGQIRDIAPRDLTFSFNEGQVIDSATLDGIRLTRAGGDGVFDRASAQSDLGTGGNVVIQLTAVEPGPSGNEISLTTTTATGIEAPVVTVDGSAIAVTLVGTLGAESTAQDLIDALTTDAEASALVTATVATGNPNQDVTFSDATVQLSGYNSASIISDLGVSGLQVQFTAINAGAAGNGITIAVTASDHGAGSLPTVSVSGTTISVDLNTNPLNPTDVATFIATLNAHPDASQLVDVALLAGNQTADLSAASLSYSPLILSGAGDEIITPGFIGIGESPREVVMRFAEPLPDDLYRIDIIGSGPSALQNIEGGFFGDATDDNVNVGTNFNMSFELDLGARVVSIVPQPVTRNESGALVQARNQIEVYFNDDDLSFTAEEPRFYQLIFTNDTVQNTDDVIYHPTSVAYDPTTDRATLTFANDLDEFAVGAGTFRLRIGTDEAQPTAPLSLEPVAVGVTDFNTGGQVEVTFTAVPDAEPATNITVEFTKSEHVEFGAPNAPLVRVSGDRIVIDLDTTNNLQTTAQQVVDAINGNLFARTLITAEITGGDANTNVASPAINYSPVGLSVLGLGSTFANAMQLGPSVVIADDLATLADGSTLTVTDANGDQLLFEMDRGYSLRLPADGGEGLSDGASFTYGDGSQTVTFAMDNDGQSESGQTAIAFTADESADVIGARIVDELLASGLAVTPVYIGDGVVHLGGVSGHTLTSTGELLAEGAPGITTAGAERVPFTPDGSQTGSDIATQITDFINASDSTVAVAYQDANRVTLIHVASAESTSTAVSVENTQSIVVSSAIDPEFYGLNLPGDSEDPGHRDIDDVTVVQTHLGGTADTTDGVSTFFYNFRDDYAPGLNNVITEQQKERAREVFQLYSNYLGVQFVESASAGLTIATGDMRAINPFIDTGPGGTLGLNDGQGLAVLDGSENWDDTFGASDNAAKESWFEIALREVGGLLGLGSTGELPAFTSTGSEPILTFDDQDPDPSYPGDHDLVHGKHLFRNESKDIDMFRVELTDTGIFTAETIAERQLNSSLLDTVLTLYREEGGNFELLARNDDYYSNDSYIEFALGPGTYYVGVSSTGNDDYDPLIEDSGFGGTTQGHYDLRINFRPDADNSIVDADNGNATALDGDGDGTPGGVFNFWFRAESESNTHFVDKSADNPGNGSLLNPFDSIPRALAAASPGDIVRIVGNAGADGLMTTLDDNLAYEIGFDNLGRPLADGADLEVPQGVTVMIDSGSIVKLRRSRVDVGSSSPVDDRSAGALQVLGTPHLIDSAGDVVLLDGGQAAPGSVYFTSFNDATIGVDNADLGIAPAPGDWGGLIFRMNIDEADDRFTYENAGIFLNYVNNADIRYGGGSVVVDSVPQVVTPIHLVDARPTISNNDIQLSADAAISATPDSFAETNFHAPEFQFNAFTSEYQRIGPEIVGNHTVDNSLNGLFVRVATPAGSNTLPLTVSARFDDNDITHVVADNLIIQGTPGGPMAESARPAVNATKLQVLTGGTLEAGTYNYKITFVDRDGNEGPASSQTSNATIVGGPVEGTILLTDLPEPIPGFVARRIYRSDNTGNPDGVYTLVDQINARDNSFTDDGSQIGGEILQFARPAIQDIQLSSFAGFGVTDVLSAGTYNYRIVFVDPAGNEGPVSDPTSNLTIQGGTRDGNILIENIPTPTPGFVATRIYRSDRAANPDGMYLLIAQIPGGQDTFTDTGIDLDQTLTPALVGFRARMDARLSVDPGVVVKFNGGGLETRFGGDLIAEGLDGQEVIFTSVVDDRYGAGGTFDASNDGRTSGVAGSWGGVFIGHTSTGSIDHAVIADAGGLKTIAGSFAGFNALEVHQADARVTNTVFENNADGTLGQALSGRAGRGPNADSVIFIRSSQPVIVGNTIQNNDATALNINANALNHFRVSDLGRSTGHLGVMADGQGNHGPLIADNRLGNNSINGMQVRGATLTTEGVWDDTSIVHVIQNETIYVPDHHTYGGLRLESDNGGSLVVKLLGANAGFTATGRPLDINDRIGGRIHIVGQPGFPVVLTSLNDDTVGAGLQPDGSPSLDTDNDGSGESITFPTEADVPNGTLIDNDVPSDEVGHFEIQPGDGGAVGFVGGGSGVTGQGLQTFLENEDFIFDYANLVQVGSGNPHVDLAATNVTTSATLISPDRVRSAGTFAGQNGDINWAVESYFMPGIAILFNEFEFSSTAPFGEVQFTNYLDQDILSVFDDIVVEQGVSGAPDYRIATLDGPERIGFSQGGLYDASQGLEGATWAGWAADIFADLINEIVAGTQQFSPAGTVDLTSTPVTNDPDLGQVFGPADMTTAMAWTLDPDATTSRLTTFLEFIPDNSFTDLGSAGDWRSIQIDQFSSDRNVDVQTEREPANADAPGINSTPDEAQFLGMLAPHEHGGDDVLRLGYEVHGMINEPGDVDVYSFDAQAGTEVWIDIDNTTHRLDTVVELIDATGRIIALSDNTLEEAVDGSLLYRSAGELAADDIHSLQSSPDAQYPQHSSGLPQDRFTTNPRDAGMRVVLPGPAGIVTTYHVRVRSSNLAAGDPASQLRDPARLYDGLTSGGYELGLRLREQDEAPGSTVQFADIRFATNGIEVLGMPGHSPLIGEAAEVVDATTGLDNNGDVTTAEPLGNLLNSDLATLSVAGNLLDETDIDWYQLDVEYDSSVEGGTNHVSAIFDIDYSGSDFGRPDTNLYIFDSAGQLVLTSRNSNVGDDLSTPTNGADLEDLSRGSASGLDAFIGTVELPAAPGRFDGTYFIAVTNQGQRPLELDQFSSRNPANPLLRLEPINSVVRIAEDQIESFGGSTIANSPTVPVLFDADSIVPLNLSDIVLFATTDSGANQSQLNIVNPYTGTVTNVVGEFNANVEDIALSPDGELHGFNSFEGQISDANTGNLHFIDPRSTNLGSLSTNLGDDGIETYEPDPMNPGQIVRANDGAGYGVHFNGLTFGDFGNGIQAYGVGQRGDFPRFTFGGLGDFRNNILYEMSEIDGQATSSPAQDRDMDAITASVTRTQIVERAVLDTLVDPIGPGNTVLGTVEATSLANNQTQPVITDGLRFVIDDGQGTPFTFELNSGPEVILTHTPGLGITVRDGDTFSVDGNVYTFDTGSVIVVTAANGNGIADRDTVIITDNANPPVTQTFEFDNAQGGPPIGNGNVPVSFDAGMNQAQIINQLIDAINSVPNFNVQAELMPNSNRISLIGESATVGASENSQGIQVEGAPGASGTVIPVEETFDTFEFGAAIDAAIEGNPDASVAGQRLNFAGALTADFSQIVARGVFTIDTNSNGAVTPGTIAVPFLAGDSAQSLAARIAATISSATSLVATATNSSVQLSGFATVQSADAPLLIGGMAPGGDITGMAVINGQMYAVTGPSFSFDGIERGDGGGLYQILSPGSTFATADYIETATDLLTGEIDALGNATGGPIQFTGLTAGPQNVEGGRFAELLFGIDVNGRLYAFDTTGALQPVFVDGQTSIPTDLFGVQGIAFAKLDTNLWHVTGRRRTDDGHGYDLAFDESRGDENPNSNLSLYFGYEGDQVQPELGTDAFAPRNIVDYDFAGGAHGSLESNYFSLAGYSAADQPVLYFNYFIDSEDTDFNPGSELMRDSFRAFIGDDTGEWQLIATNDSYRGSGAADDEFDYGPFAVQELFDNSGWRQARVDLGPYAGRDNLRLRFDFSTAGSFNVGDPTTSGDELRAIDGSQLQDGQTFTITNLDGTTTPFEIEMGYTLVTPSVDQVSDGDGFIIDGQTYQFDSDNVFSQNIEAVSGARIDDADVFTVSDGVDTVTFEFDAGLSLSIPAAGGNVFGGIQDGDTFTIDPGDGSGPVIFEYNKDGISSPSSDVLIALTQNSTQDEIALTVVNQISLANVGLDPTYLGNGVVHVGGEGHIIDVSNTPTMSVTGNPGIENADAVRVPYVPHPSMTAEQMAIVLADAINSTSLNVTATAIASLVDLAEPAAAFSPGTTPLSPDGNAGIQFTEDMSSAELAAAIEQAILRTPPPVTQFTGNIQVESNDTIGTALNTGMNNTAGQFITSGAIGDNPGLPDPTLDVDLFSIQLQAGDQLTVDIDAAETGSGLDSILRVFDPEGIEVITSDDDARPGEIFSTDSFLEYVVTTPGTYYIGVSSFSNTDYNPFADGTGTGGTTIGPYDIEIAVSNAGGIIHRNGNQLNLPTAVDISQFGLPVNFITGAPGTLNGVPVRVHSGMEAAEVAENIAIVFASQFSNGIREDIRTNDELVRVYNRSVTDPGPFGLAITDLLLPMNGLDGDEFGAFNASANNPGAQRAQDNDHEGVYIDDIIIGFAERGEMVTQGTVGETSFVALDPGTSIVSGGYQLEVRRGEEYGLSTGPPVPTLCLDPVFCGARSFDTNARLSDSVSLLAPDGANVTEGRTFVISDGTAEVTFEYDDVTIGDGVGPGNIPVPFAPADTAALVAASIRDAINSDQVQVILDLSAASADGTTAGTLSTSRVVNLFGNATVEGFDDGVQVSEVSDTLIDAVDTGIVDGLGTFFGIGEIGDNTRLPNVALDVDLFAVNLNEEDQVIVDVNAADIGSALDTYVRIFDAAGNEVDFNDNQIDFVNNIFTTDSFLSFTAPSDGTYYVGLSDALNSAYDPDTEGSGVGINTGEYEIFIGSFGDIGGNRAATVVFSDEGDSNTERQQGQVVLHSNQIRNSLGFGVLVNSGANDRSDLVPLAGDLPHQGPPRITNNVNTEGWVPGVTITNNVISSSQGAAIGIGGNVPGAGDATAVVPVSRVINNTLYGLGGSFAVQDPTLDGVDTSALNDFGILVVNNSSPTLLNNVIANFSVGVGVGASSASTVSAGNVYQANDQATLGSAVVGDNAIQLFPDEPLFINGPGGNFYPAPNSRIIDSAVDSLEERFELANIREPLGIEPSPILAPNYDVSGLLRADDPNVSPPVGIGLSVFKDRGAVDRSDFIGSTARLVAPVDNDPAGLDIDPAESFVEATNVTLSTFSIQLTDGSDVFNPLAGSGIDDATVLASTVNIFQDGEQLEFGVDYTFNYDFTNNVIILTPTAGLWELDSNYEVELINRDRYLAGISPGDQLQEGNTFNVVDSFGNSVTFEYDSGYVITVPTEGAAAGGVADQETFSLSDGTTTVVYEFDANRRVSDLDHQAVTIQDGTVGGLPPSTQQDVVDALVAALASSPFGLSPTDLGDGRIHVGGMSGLALDTASSALAQTGAPGAQTSGAIAISFVPSEDFSDEQAAVAVANAINLNTTLVGVTATVLDGNVIVHGAGNLSNGVFIGAISDIAGNTLRPNRPNGDTRFTILLGSGLDFGDAPDNFPTLGDIGARHEIQDGFQLGTVTTDADLDGQSNEAANGDDIDGNDDDDGIVFTSLLLPGEVATLTVTATGVDVEGGKLDAWIDFNSNGSWNDSGEQIFTSLDLSEGENHLSFSVPRGAILTNTYGRFRLSRDGGLGPGGFAPDGEVEDYRLRIGSPWQNSSLAEDVSGDGEVSPIDALLVINYINANGNGAPLPAPPTEPPPFYDVNGNDIVDPNDVLRVINVLNALSSGEVRGAGEADPILVGPQFGTNDSQPSQDAEEGVAESRSGIEIPFTLRPQHKEQRDLVVGSVEVDRVSSDLLEILTGRPLEDDLDSFFEEL